MPERVTKAERTVSRAIAKARETKELLQQESTHERLPLDEEMEVVKVKRPKAQTSKHGITQDKVHANADNSKPFNGKLKKKDNSALESIKDDIDGNLGVIGDVAEMYFRDQSESSLRALEKDLSAIAKRYN
tara:strand:- start:479 stop:871 length:393 start_codon:yes stop_codon:yes gene_type:complete